MLEKVVENLVEEVLFKEAEEKSRNQMSDFFESVYPDWVVSYTDITSNYDATVTKDDVEVLVETKTYSEKSKYYSTFYFK